MGSINLSDDLNVNKMIEKLKLPMQGNNSVPHSGARAGKYYVAAQYNNVHRYEEA